MMATNTQSEPKGHGMTVFLQASWRRTLLLAICDVAVVYIVYRLTFVLRSLTAFYFFSETMPLSRYQQVTHYIWLFAVAQIAFFYFFGLYDRFVSMNFGELVKFTLSAVTIETSFIVSFYYLVAEFNYPRSVFLVFWLLNNLATLALRYTILRLVQDRKRIRRFLIVGQNHAADNLSRELARLPSTHTTIVGYVEEPENRNEAFCQNLPYLGSRADIPALVHQHHIDEVILTSTNSWQEQLIDAMSQQQNMATRISVIPTCYEILIGKVNHLRIYDIPLIEVVKQHETGFGSFLKRALDLLFAAIILIVTIPFFIIVPILQKLLAPGPVFFGQERLGKNKKPFRIYKFRTMIPDAEDETGPVLAEPQDPRITPFGRFLRKYRIDELPQLYNILKGDMSFVGPRPERQHFVEEFIGNIPGYAERFRVKPGITGLAQVNGGYATTPENKLKYDLAYIYNRSLWLDVRIVLETVKVIISGKSGY